MAVEARHSRRRMPPRADDPAQGGGRIEALTKVRKDTALLLVANIEFSRRRSFRGWIVTAPGESQEVRGIRLQHYGADASDLILVRSARKGNRLRPEGQLVIDVGDSAIALEPADVRRAELGPGRFGSGHLVSLAPETRLALLDEIIGRLSDRPGGMREASSALRALRDAVLPHFPAAEVSTAATVSAQVDAFYRVDETSFYIEGWVVDRTDSLESLRLIAPEGCRIEILETAFRYPRPDVAEFFGFDATARPGFICYGETREAGLSPAGWVMQVVLSDGTGVEVEVPSMLDDPRKLRAIILGDIDLDDTDDRLKTCHTRPALGRLEERLANRVEIATIDQHGDPPVEPAVSIVVPLYVRTDFLEHQLAQFAHDPELNEADLVYVLDSPEDAKRLRVFASHLFQLYRVPFRLACLTANGGFSAVNNLGAAMARGSYLLLLNSDILPAEPGWLSKLVAFLESDEKIGAVAPKLLYEDDSIQHAGLYFDRPSGAATWSNEHYFKGLHRDFPPANIARSVPAITGACLLIETELYRNLGGLAGGYVRGDYEDSDLCLRLHERDKECWYFPGAELYHLEGQSYPSVERENASRFNQWLHTATWEEQLMRYGEK